MPLITKTLLNVSQSDGTLINQTSSVPDVIPLEGDVVASLLYTSSNGEENLGSTSKSIVFEGSREPFPLSTYTPIGFNDIISLENENVHINDVDGMYFVKYETNGINLNTEFIDNGFKLRENTNSSLIITQSEALPGDDEYRFTGSLQVYKGNLEDNPEGDLLHEEEFILNTSGSTGIEGTTHIYYGEYKYNDTFRFAIKQIEKTPVSGLNITSYTSSISPIFSRFSMNPDDINNILNDDTGSNEPEFISTNISNYYGENVLPFNFAVDCQPLINNATTNRLSSFLQDVDYSNVTGSLIPINQQQLINFEAVKAAIPDSNYSSLRIIIPRYKGSKSTSSKLNIWTPKDIGTYGKLPTIELRNAIFGYFDKLIDPYPNINDKVQLNLTYLIDEQGNALPPNLGDNTISSLDSTFPEGKQARISLNEGSKELKKLNNPYNTSIVGSYIAPIMYTQISGHSYTTELPLTGSGRISMYDDGANAFTNLAFSAQGTPSTPPTSSVFAQLFSTTFDLPNVEYDSGGGDNPGNSFETGNGKIVFDSDSDANSGENTSQDYTIFFETSFATNFLYESGTVEMNVKLSLDNNGVNIPFNFEDIQLKVHKGGQVIDLGSVITNSNDIVRFETQGLSQQKGLNSNNEVEMLFENYAIANFLISKNLYVNGKGGSDFKGDIDAFEWVLKANTQNYNTKFDDVLQWNLKGKLRGGDERTNVFFPSEYPGDILPTKITMVGSKNHLFANDNTGSAPFWTYPGSNYNTLVMQSPNINEAYGQGYFQGDLEYTPGPSEFFPTGQEPSNTKFDGIEFPIEFKSGDEIRFGNNENYTYTIKRVFTPEENIESDGKGRIKIVLNKEVPTSINKDFFLIRRKVKSKNAVLLDVNFPYGTPVTASSSPGILYPEFPTELLNNSASLIVEDLVDKGIIK